MKHRDNITKVFDKYLESLTPLDFMKDKELENYSDLHNQNLASTKHKQLKYPDIKDCLIKQTVYYDGKLLDEKTNHY